MTPVSALTREERETVINRSEAEETWNVYTSSPAVMRRLDKWAKVLNVEYMDGQIVSKEYDVPRSSVSIRKPRKMSAAQKNQLKTARETSPTALKGKEKAATP